MTQDSFSDQQDIEGTEGAVSEQGENATDSPSYGGNSSTEGTYGEQSESQPQDQSYGEQSQDQSYGESDGDSEGQSEGGRSESQSEQESETEPEGGYSGVAVDLPPLEGEQAEESTEGEFGE